MPTDEYFLKLLDRIRQAAGAKMLVTVEDLPEVVERLKRNSDRYEKVRKMDAGRFLSVCSKNYMTGVPFDEIIDGIKED